MHELVSRKASSLHWILPASHRWGSSLHCCCSGRAPPCAQGLPTPPERALEFSVPLGARETRTFRFRHLLDDRADYKVTVVPAAVAAATGPPAPTPGERMRSAYEVPSSVSAPPAPPAPTGSGAREGVEVAVDVTFEPAGLGEGAREMMIISSPTGE